MHIREKEFKPFAFTVNVEGLPEIVEHTPEKEEGLLTSLGLAQLVVLCQYINTVTKCIHWKIIVNGTTGKEVLFTEPEDVYKRQRHICYFHAPCLQAGM